MSLIPKKDALRRLPTYHACFGCGDDNPRGLQVDFYTDGESVWTEWTPTEPFMGYRGIVHGGVLAAILDEAMGWGAYVGSGLMGKTAELTVRYLESVPLGAPVLVRAWTTENKRDRIVVAAAEMTDGRGKAYMRASGKFMPLTRADTLEVDRYLTYHQGPPLEYKNR